MSKRHPRFLLRADHCASAKFSVTIIVHAVLLALAEEPYCMPKASVWTAYYDPCDARQLYRRVFVPSAELLRAHLPEPEV